MGAEPASQDYDVTPAGPPPRGEVRCPACRSTRVRRSRRHGTRERAVSTVLRLFPFRCLVCQQRFWRFRRAG